MTQQEKDKIMNIVQDFVNDNLGQKVTKWNGASLLGTMNDETSKMILPSEVVNSVDKQ